MADRKQEIATQVTAEFENLERKLEASNPGVMEVLRVYGGYELAVQQAELYIGLADPKPAAFLTTDTSNR